VEDTALEWDGGPRVINGGDIRREVQERSKGIVLSSRHWGGNRGGVCAEGDALQVRAGHVDAADSWAKEGDAKRLHNRPCGRSLGKVLGRVVVVSTGHRERVNTRALVVGREINAEAEGNAKKTQNEKRKRRKKQTTFKLV